ncbi:MAG: hypothetical protein IT428_32945 [Planctomycetaceae bacterium]|nr:hypothetical protein [Planctomycetaceae bacterium]
MPKTAKQPSDLLYKPTGQIRVRLNGRNRCLGQRDSPASRDGYHQVVTEWFGKQGNVDPISLTVDGLVIQYLAFAAKHYQKNGKPTSEPSCVRIAMRPLVAVAGSCVRSARLEAGTATDD